MAAQLDHMIIPARDRRRSAQLLAGILGADWADAAAGPFTAVFVNEGLTLDFDQHEGPLPVLHYCFRVSEAEFDLALGRLQALGLQYRSSPHGATDMQVGAHQGGRIVYWSEPDGHVWELLTVSYARASARQSAQ